MSNDAFADLRRGPWAIFVPCFTAMEEFVKLNPTLGNLSPAELWARMMGTGPNPSPRANGTVGIISVYGAIGRGLLKEFTSFFRYALGDRNVRAIIFDIDSPGGPVDGVPELAEEIFAARGRKKRSRSQTR